MTAPLIPVTREPVVTLLENGDKLTREEFERRYDTMPELKKAELIEGVGHMPSPVRFHRHGSPQFKLITWLGTYQAGTLCVLGGDNSTARMDLGNEPQPDALLRIDPAWGGQASLSADDFHEGAPGLVAAIPATRAPQHL